MPCLKDPAKLSFVLLKHPNSSLPDIPTESNRLTANRMLRVKKVLQFLSEKLGVLLDPNCCGEKKVDSDGKRWHVKLYCNGKLINYRMTLASIKYVICKGGSSDLIFYYLEQ